MPIPKRKIDQLKRFEEDPNRRRRLQRKHKNLSNNLDNQRNFVTRILFQGKKRIIKFAEGENLQRKNISLLLKHHSRLAKMGKINTKGYTLDPTPYQYSDKRIGLMKDIGEVSLKHVHGNLSDLGIYGQVKFSGPKIVEFVKKYNLDPKKTLEIFNRARKNLRKVETLNDLYSDTRIGDNIFITGFDPKTYTFKLAIIDQIGPSFATDKTVSERLKNDK